MNIYYNASLWNYEEEGVPGEKQEINFEFEHDGLNRVIPCIYRFEKGIVFDIITILDETKMKQYWDKYNAIQEELTDFERECAEQECPYQNVDIKEIHMNSKETAVHFSLTSSSYLPFVGKCQELLDLQEQYQSVLKGSTCFACQRFCISYPEEVLETGVRLTELKLTTYEKYKEYPLGMSCSMSEENPNGEIQFLHPVTQKESVIYLNFGKQIDIIQDVTANEKMYFASAVYEIVPQLSDTEEVRFALSEFKMERNAASIGIIGGADGPTSIFIAGKTDDGIRCGEHGLPIYPCFSKRTTEKPKNYQFCLQKMVVEVEGSKTYRFEL